MNLLENIVNMIFLFFGNRIRGYRTYIASGILAITGILTFVGENPFFDPSPQAVGVIATIFAIASLILKKLDNLKLKKGER